MWQGLHRRCPAAWATDQVPPTTHSIAIVADDGVDGKEFDVAIEDAPGIIAAAGEAAANYDGKTIGKLKNVMKTKYHRHVQ